MLNLKVSRCSFVKERTTLSKLQLTKQINEVAKIRRGDVIRKEFANFTHQILRLFIFYVREYLLKHMHDAAEKRYHSNDSFCEVAGASLCRWQRKVERERSKMQGLR